MIFITEESIVAPWVCEKNNINWQPNRYQAIGKIKNQRLVAGVLYEGYTGTNIICHIAGEPGWACREFLGLIYDYPFNQLNVKRLTAQVYSVNEKSISLVERMGFKLESRLEEAIPGGDILLYRLLKKDYKFIYRGNYGKSERSTATARLQGSSKRDGRGQP